MTDDIPQDQVEAVSREVLTVIRANTAIFNDVGLSLTIARAAIRVLTPLIAAVERERCARIADEMAAKLQHGLEIFISDNGQEGFKPHDGKIVSYSAGAAFVIAESIRSVKGAVT